MSSTLQTALAVAGVIPIAWMLIWLFMGTLNAVAEDRAVTTLTFRGFWANAGFLAMFACAALTLARAM
jgi:hypothetical protein